MPATEDIDRSFLQSLFSLPRKPPATDQKNETTRLTITPKKTEQQREQQPEQQPEPQPERQPEQNSAPGKDDRQIVSQILDHISVGLKQAQPGSKPVPPIESQSSETIPKQKPARQQKRKKETKSFKKVNNGKKNSYSAHYDEKKYSTQDKEPIPSRNKLDELDFDQLLNMHETAKSKPPQDTSKDTSLTNVAYQILGRQPKKQKTNQQRHSMKQRSSQQAMQSQSPQQQQQHERRPKPICVHWKTGTCIEGEKCPFRHEGKQFITVCRYFKSSSCSKGNACPFSHELKVEPCRFYHVKGVCDAGDTCPFSHDELTPELRKRLHDMTGPCRFYHFKGYCNNGEDCVFSHGNISEEELKKLESTLEPCVFYHLKGGCSQGNDCFYLHEEISNETRQRLLQQQQELIKQQQQQQHSQHLQQPHRQHPHQLQHTNKSINKSTDIPTIQFLEKASKHDQQ